MKIILSRKGFDTSNGGIPSPILSDGTLLSMPIPSEDALSFSDLRYGEHTYYDIILQLAPKFAHKKCHLDPDIREFARVKPVPDWKPAFGQVGAAQTYLRNNNVKDGDLFIFFGRFQQTVGSISDGTLRFDNKAPILHIIFGYLEVGGTIQNEILADGDYSWHPHGHGERLDDKTNMVYAAADKLSLGSNRRGWGTFDYADHRVLTLGGKTATWQEIPCLMPDAVEKNVKNSAKGQGIYYQGIWQELVLKENASANAWANEIFES